MSSCSGLASQICEFLHDLRVTIYGLLLTIHGFRFLVCCLRFMVPVYSTRLTAYNLWSAGHDFGSRLPVCDLPGKDLRMQLRVPELGPMSPSWIARRLSDTHCHTSQCLFLPRADSCRFLDSECHAPRVVRKNLIASQTLTSMRFRLCGPAALNWTNPASGSRVEGNWCCFMRTRISCQSSQRCGWCVSFRTILLP